MPVRIFIAVLISASLAAGCGRRGPLEAPRSAINVESEGPGSPGTLDAVSPGAQQPDAHRPVEVPPQRFVLDPLL